MIEHRNEVGLWSPDGRLVGVLNAPQPTILDMEKLAETYGPIKTVQIQPFERHDDGDVGRLLGEVL